MMADDRARGAAATASPRPPASRRTVEILRAIVIGLGLLLVIAFLILVGRLLYLAFATPAQAPAPASPPRPAATRTAPEVALALPAGASIKAVSLSGDRLAVHYTSPTGDGILIVDAATGEVVGRLKAAPAAP